MYLCVIKKIDVIPDKVFREGERVSAYVFSVWLQWTYLINFLL